MTSNTINSPFSEEDLSKWLINSSISQSAVRNHGVGIVKGIRFELYRCFDLNEFKEALLSNQEEIFDQYLRRLTRLIANKCGRDEYDKPTESKIKWGAARKCINLLARSIVYNGFIWHFFNIHLSDFEKRGYIRNLELPLDSYAIEGLRKDAKKYGVAYPQGLLNNFTIIGLRHDKSAQIQELAQKVAEKRATCKVHLDIIYWRKAVEEGNFSDI